MNVTLTLNDRDFSSRLATYKVTKEIAAARVVETLDGTEHATQKDRDVITFSLWPFSDTTAMLDYNALSAMEFVASYTDTVSGQEKSAIVRIASNLDAAFGIDSIDGNRYYKGGEIVLRSKMCN